MKTVQADTEEPGNESDPGWEATVDGAKHRGCSLKAKALQEVPKPQTVSELKSYLGLLTYYFRFLPNLSTAFAPFYKLLQRSDPWKWTSAQDQLLKRYKKMLLESQLLVHFDLSLEICLACDASSYGTGAVLSHQMPMGLRSLLALCLVP